MGDELAFGERHGRLVQLRHIDNGCTGWIHAGARTLTREKSADNEPGDYKKPDGAPDREVYVEVRPCDICQRGKYAVWVAGLMEGDWVNDERARELFFETEGRYPHIPGQRRQVLPADSSASKTRARRAPHIATEDDG